MITYIAAPSLLYSFCVAWERHSWRMSNVQDMPNLRVLLADSHIDGSQCLQVFARSGCWVYAKVGRFCRCLLLCIARDD